jgi:HD-like signal output (HDOD) protein
VPVSADATGSRAPEGALDRLLQRMHENEDFPAMSHAVSRIQAMAASESESVGAVADEILKDVALSNKLLRIVNSAYYARGGGISTISRAVTLIGFNGLRNMAMGLVLLEGMKDKDHAEVLVGEFLRALMAASIARELTGSNRDGEETFIGAMFQDLGRLLAMYYFAQESTQVLALLRAGGGKLTEDSASIRVLGLSYANLGLGVAKL